VSIFFVSSFDHELLLDRENPEVKAIINQQENQFATRVKNLENRQGILTQRTAQLREATKGLEKQLIGVREQLRLIQEEVETEKKLLEQGYATKPRVSALQRAEAELIGQEGKLISDIAKNQEAIGEANLRVLNLETEYLEEIDTLLSQAQSDLASLEKIYWESRDELLRTSIISPVDGIVLNIKFKTQGGVISPGEPILDIVPEEDDLIINAKVRPQDIDEISLGMEAYVVFKSYQQRYLQRINGEVIHISADVLVDPSGEISYYLAKIRVNAEDLEKQDIDIRLTPGMPVEVFITTGARTFLDYLLQPVSRTFDRVLREP